MNVHLIPTKRNEHFHYLIETKERLAATLGCLRGDDKASELAIAMFEGMLETCDEMLFEKFGHRLQKGTAV